MLKIMYIFNTRLDKSLNHFFVKELSSKDTTLETRQWRQSLKKSIDKVYEQVNDIATNIGMKSVDQSSLEELEKQIETLRDKAAGLSLLLRESSLSFDKRFFYFVSQLITGSSRETWM